jgi:tRNA(Ile)-lysidine synthase TilS/MesJ
MKGNCVDKFIRNRLNQRLRELLDIRLKIKLRCLERENIEDYFSSSLYEMDFADIRKLRDTAKELESNCNKFLERISEQYSKLT